MEFLIINKLNHFIFIIACFCVLTQQTNENNTVVFRTVVDGEEIIFRVVNGRAGRLGEVPYQISFMKRKKDELYSSFCGGSIIRPAKVLTAAHCISPKYMKTADAIIDSKDLAVVAGQLWNTAKFGMQGQWRLLSKAMYMPTYKFPKDDVALLILRKKFNFNFAVQPIPYATTYLDFTKECKASGYGFIGNSQGSRFLLVADIKTLSRRACHYIHRWNTTKFVCTSDEIANIHSGDSGGPLVCNNTGDPAEGNSGIQIGVVCAGHDHNAMMTLFSRVSEFNDFVASFSNLHLSSSNILILVLILHYYTAI